MALFTSKLNDKGIKCLASFANETLQRYHCLVRLLLMQFLGSQKTSESVQVSTICKATLANAGTNGSAPLLQVQRTGQITGELTQRFLV